MDPFDRYFTEGEANALLRELLRDIEDLMATRNRIVEIRPELESGLQKALGNGGSQATGELLSLMRRVKRSVERIQGTGVLVKDLDRGLLDFPAERDGRIIFLCWQYGEPTVAYWHDIDAGFAGRQPL
ncbi:MAG: DUF2203 domain-containing protein [Chloroflexi bacterium]|nr:DUF2203 domain-containing protein [Chloroflexota bacterium]